MDKDRTDEVGRKPSAKKKRGKISTKSFRFANTETKEEKKIL